MSLQSMPATSSRSRMASQSDYAKWNAGASPCTDGIIGKECVRRHYGTRMEGVQYLT